MDEMFGNIFFFKQKTAYEIMPSLVGSEMCIRDRITAAPDIEAYLSFMLTMFMAFGTAFEVPVVLMVLVRFGLVTVEQLKSWRNYFIVVAFIVAAIVTPPDVVSQTSLAVSMILLFEIGILAAKYLVKYSAPPDEEQKDAQSSASP